MDQHVWDYPVCLNELVPEQNRQLLKEVWNLSGASLSALRTGFRMGRFRLDAGHTVLDNWEILLISHGHADHVFSLASFLMTKQYGPIYTPEKMVELIKTVGMSVLRANGGAQNKKHIFLPATETFRFENYLIETMELVHSVPAVGYGISSTIKVLNDELAEIIRVHGDAVMKDIVNCVVKKGAPSDVFTVEEKVILSNMTTMNQEKIFPQFCFLCDTSIEGISNNITRIAKYPIIIVECTFYEEEDLVEAHRKKHIHWQQLKPYVDKYTDSLWVLVHHSQKQDIERAKDIVSSSNNALVFLNDRRPAAVEIAPVPTPVPTDYDNGLPSLVSLLIYLIMFVIFINVINIR